MHTNLLLSTKVTRVKAAVAAGTTDVTSDAIDMEGFDAALFTVLFGTLTAGQVTSLLVQGSTDSAFTSPQALVGAVSIAFADTDDDKVAMIEVQKVPDYRYLRIVVDRGTANAVVDGILAMQYSARKQPTTHDATTVADAIVSISPRPSSSDFTSATVTPTGTTTRINSTRRSSS